ncbi:MAG: pyridoxamine 5'-phosphate oxidase family protein [Bryobacterales bacterium]|nr:pyridoxamine 5'-phosphate oxidase family protein [Bryobacterales bacterium]
MLTDTFFEVLRHEGVAAIATLGSQPHMVNTWNSYIRMTEDGRCLLIPVGGMHQTEKNVAVTPKVLLTVGAREVTGKRGLPGTGFLVAGTAEFLSEGEDFDRVKAEYGWARAVLKVTVASATQTL